MSNTFVNPYNYVPTPPRQDLPDTVREDLGDHPGVALDRLHEGRFTGVLRVTMTAKSPIVVIDPGSVRIDRATGHKQYDPATLALAGDGEGRSTRPRVEVTQIKGMLSDAFEAITNSRYRVFEGHGERLGRRMGAGESKRMVPVRCLPDGSLEVLAGTVPKGMQQANAGLMHAAFVPMYPGGPSVAGVAPVMDDYGVVTPAIGSELWAWVERVQHKRWNGKTHVDDFQCWRVLELALSGGSLSTTPPSSRGAPPLAPPRNSWHAIPGTIRPIRGWFHCTNRNINRKHDERLFFHDLPGDPEVIRGEDATRLRAHYRAVVASYVGAHDRAEIHERPHGGGRAKPHEYLGREPGKTAWSRHVYDGQGELQPGGLAYARWNGHAWDGLFPVSIARELYESSPEALLSRDGLTPARRPEELSPADRLFGWTSQAGSRADESALRGRVRVQAVDTSGAAIEYFPEPLSLAILGRPRDQQARFTTTLAVGRGAPAQRQPDGTEPASLFKARSAAPHRKRYVTQPLLSPSHWSNPTAERSQEHVGGIFREYRRPAKGEEVEQEVQLTGGPPGHATKFAIAQPSTDVNDRQNRSITGWIEQGGTIRFELQLTDVSTFELGALLWLLTLPGELRIGLGYGKPLGLGSVHLALDGANSIVYDNATLIERMRLFSMAPLPEAERLVGADSVGERAVTHFKGQVAAAYATEPEPADLETRFLSVPFIKEFLAIARGNSTVPVHYPRVRPKGMAPDVPVPINPAGRNYEWFVANERTEPGRRRSLPLMSDGGELDVYEM